MNLLKEFLSFSESLNLTFKISKKYFREVVLVPALSSILYGIISVIVLIIPIGLAVSLFGFMFWGTFEGNLAGSGFNNNSSYNAYLVIGLAIFILAVLFVSLISYVFYIKQNQRMAEAIKIYFESIEKGSEDQKEGFSIFEKKFESNVSFFSNFNIKMTWDIFLYVLKISMFAIIGVFALIGYFVYVSYSGEFRSNTTTLILLFLVTFLFFIFGIIYTNFQLGRKGHGILAIIEGVEREEAWELSEKTIGENFWPNAIRYFLFSLVIAGISLVLSTIDGVFQIVLGLSSAFGQEYSSGTNATFVSIIIYLTWLLAFQFSTLCISMIYTNFNYLANKNLLSLKENETVVAEYGLSDIASEKSPVEDAKS
jgi:hypothetical protein